MPLTAEQRRRRKEAGIIEPSQMPEARRARYAREWKSDYTHQPTGRVMVPDDVERRAIHTPCFFCGSAGHCRHRPESRAESPAPSKPAENSHFQENGMAENCHL